MNTKDLKELRKELKEIGFNIKTKSLSFGLYGTLVSNDKENTGNVYTEETFKFWKPAFDILRKYSGAEFILNGSKVYGLWDLALNTVYPLNN